MMKNNYPRNFEDDLKMSNTPEIRKSWGRRE